MSDTASNAPVPAPELPAGPAPKLDELMLAMDVVDTLRHQDQLIEKELSQEDRDAALKKRLREMYESQGLTVTDRILEEGIEALKESRFSYTPRGDGFPRQLAMLWINRRPIGLVLGAAIILIVAVVGWNVWQAASQRQQVEATRIEVAETLPREVAQASQAALNAATEPRSRAEVERAIAAGEAAVALASASEMRETIADLNALRDRLNQDFDLRIVQVPGEGTGVGRTPPNNENATNYYIIVEAVAPDGAVLSLPITSEEDGTTRTVSQFGVRVPVSTYNAVGADKQADGIVNNRLLGEKPRGSLFITYTMPAEDGRITEW